jgi:hypothetical protein
MERVAFQGVTNIIRFNWHFYVIAIGCIAGCVIFHQYLLILLIVLSTVISLAVSWYVYDYSNLYTLDWIDFPGTHHLLNINAGFDETSILLSAKFPAAELTVFDFYDPAKHTEISIERARKAYGPYPGTMNISTDNIPLLNADLICMMLAAHEIRNREERIQFFSLLKERLNDHGQMLVLEHLRDLPNFMAYNIGFFHFFSKKEWRRTFTGAGFTIYKEIKVTPFLSAFILQKNGITS